MSRIHVTEAEGVLLEVLWRLGPLPPAQLIAEVKAARPWRGATIKTLLGRLRRKRLVSAEQQDGALRYRPTIDRSAYLRSEVQALADRLFGGDLGALAQWLAGCSLRTRPARRSTPSARARTDSR